MDPADLQELAALLARPAEELTDEELIKAVRLADADRDAARERVGRLIASLYARQRLSWPQLGNAVDIPYGTAHGLARPFLSRDEEQDRYRRCVPLTSSERRTLHAIHDGDSGPHSIYVLRSLVRRGLLTDRQKLTTAGLQVISEELTRRRDVQIRYMRDNVRAHRRRFGV